MIDEPYKLAEIDKSKIAAAAKKALIAADSQYFSWPPEQQEHFRLTMNTVASARVRRVLLNDLLGIQCSVKTVDSAWQDVNLSQLNTLNWASLLTQGLGDEMIYLNEHMAEGESLLDFPTLHDYDYDHYVFQEKVRHEESSDYAGTDYYPWAFPSWVRLLVDSQFYYATFLSLATHVCDEIETVGNDLIANLIPHKYVPGAQDGKAVKGGVLWDSKLDANGLEGQLDELNTQWYCFQRQHWIDLSRTFRSLPPTVYTIDLNWDDDPHKLFIFNNEEVLKQIRWRHFLSDSHPFFTEYSALNKILATETEHAKSWLIATHRDIMKNYDPAVIKLKKKRKLVLSHGALDDLNRLNFDDS